MYAIAVANQNGQNEVTIGNFSDALKAVAGDVAKHNNGYFFGILGGSRILLPYGVSKDARIEGLKGEDYFNNIWHSVTPEVAKDLGWPDPEGIVSNIKDGNYLLESTGNGEYIMQIGLSYVTKPDGSPYRFNWFNLRDMLNIKRDGAQQ